MVTVAQESPRQAEIETLLRESDAFSQALYPPASNHLISVDALDRPEVRFVVARLDGRIVGCGSLVLGREGKAELKRMIVTAAARGKGVGRAILESLEDIARHEGVHVIRLETGPQSHQALSLYRSFGYRERGPFGSYGPDPHSVYMAKKFPTP
jgi:putative acetyltransferase